MASAAKRNDSVALSPLSRPAQSPAASSPTSNGPRVNASPGLTSLADAGLKASTFKHAPALRGFQAPVLTGAGAMADEERENEKRAQGTSINPVFNAANVFSRDQDNATSKPSDAPPQDSSPSTSGPRPTAAGQLTADPMQIDESSSTGPGAPAQEYPDPHHRADYARDPHSRASPSEGRIEERSNKAFTYPPRPDQIVDRREPSRQLSLPGSNSTRSPQARRHRCPYCSTEFTRHHNLKSHLLTHSQEKPFACEHCNQKFRRLHDLKRHAKLHTGERPHVCDKCHRKFARGDALARHSKGPGGCAGRRGSGGDDDDGEGGSSFIDPNMEGIIYEQDEEGQAVGQKRRRSAPDNDRKRSLQMSTTSSQSGRQTSTYPPVAPMGRQEAPESSLQGTSHLSPRMVPGAGQTVVPFSSAAFAQGGMTESPTPLSPGAAESRRLSAGLPPPRARSPSVATSLAHHHISRGHGSPSISLPAAQMSHAPQLPSLSGLGTDNRARTSYPSPTSSSYGPKSGRPTPVIATHPPSAGVNGSGSTSSTHTGSVASLHRSSGGSMREVLGNPTASSGDDWFRDYVRRNEAEKQALRDDFSARQAEYETIIAELQAENAGLKGRRSSVLAPHAAP